MEIHNYETQNEELKPCPFCGNTPVWWLKGNMRTPSRTITIQCHNCGVTMSKSALRLDLNWLMNLCVEKWNNRFNS